MGHRNHIRLWGDRIFEKCGIRRDEEGDGNPFPRAGTFAASEEFYHFGAYTIYQGFASDIEAGSKAAQGAKVYLRCSTSTRCSTNAKGGAAE